MYICKICIFATPIPDLGWPTDVGSSTYYIGETTIHYNVPKAMQLIGSSRYYRHGGFKSHGFDRVSFCEPGVQIDLVNFGDQSQAINWETPDFGETAGYFNHDLFDSTGVCDETVPGSKYLKHIINGAHHRDQLKMSSSGLTHLPPKRSLFFL